MPMRPWVKFWLWVLFWWSLVWLGYNAGGFNWGTETAGLYVMFCLPMGLFAAALQSKLIHP